MLQTEYTSEPVKFATLREQKTMTFELVTRSDVRTIAKATGPARLHRSGVQDNRCLYDLTATGFFHPQTSGMK